MSLLTISAVDTSSQTEARIATLQKVAAGVLRYGLVLLLGMWGALKFAAFEAEGIRPLIEHSPLLSWMYSVFSIRAASGVLGVIEISLAILIAAHRWMPRLSGYASLAASGMFLITLSFLASTPGALEPTSEVGGFLMKDLMLLGGALFTAGESLSMATKPRR